MTVSFARTHTPEMFFGFHMNENNAQIEHRFNIHLRMLNKKGKNATKHFVFSENFIIESFLITLKRAFLFKISDVPL